MGHHPAIYLAHRRAIAAAMTPTSPATEVPLSALMAAQNSEALKSSCEEYNAALFIHIANKGKYATMKKKLDNMHLFNQGAYPKTLEKAKAYLENFQVEAGAARQIHHPGQQLEGMAFMQPGGRQVGPCHGYNKMGRLVRNCPDLNSEEKKAVLQAVRSGGGGQAHVNVADRNEANKELQECLVGVANVNVNLDEASIQSLDEDDGFFEGVAFFIPTTGSKPRLDCGRHKLFFDSCATQHSMFALEYPSRLPCTKVYLRQNCNAGSKLTNKYRYYADLRFYESEGGIANLLSVPALEKAGWKIHMETGKPVRALSPT